VVQEPAFHVFGSGAERLSAVKIQAKQLVLNQKAVPGTLGKRPDTAKDLAES